MKNEKLRNIKIFLFFMLFVFSVIFDSICKYIYNMFINQVVGGDKYWFK